MLYYRYVQSVSHDAVIIHVDCMKEVPGDCSGLLTTSGNTVLSNLMKEYQTSSSLPIYATQLQANFFFHLVHRNLETWLTSALHANTVTNVVYKNP